MENFQESKNIINSSKNICLIPSESPEAIASALALFYSLKDLDKNVNFIAEELPGNLRFLTPSLDFISYPKNFIISIPKNIAEVSQIYYEKNEDALKIFLALEKGGIKKDDISFYFSETKPDLVVTLGIKDYSEQLKNKLNGFGFLLDSPILNIDSSPLTKSEQVDLLPLEKTDVLANPVQEDGTENKKFGKINLIREPSLAETVFGVIKSLNSNTIKKDAAACLLSGIVIHTENFKKNLTADIFQTAGELMKAEADLKKITENLKI